MILSCELIEIQPCSLPREEDQQQEDHPSNPVKNNNNIFNYPIENMFVKFSDDMDINHLTKTVQLDLPSFINLGNICEKSTSVDDNTDNTPHTGKRILWFKKRIKEISNNDSKKKN